MFVPCLPTSNCPLSNWRRDGTNSCSWILAHFRSLVHPSNSPEWLFPVSMLATQQLLPCHLQGTWVHGLMHSTPPYQKTFVECLVIWRGGSIWNSTQQMQIPNDNPFSIVFISVTISVPLMDYPFQKKKSPYPIQHSVKASREIRVSWQRQSRTDKKIIQRTECILSL